MKRAYVAIVVPPHGDVVVDHYEKSPDYKTLQRYVGGLIQQMPYFTKITIDGVEYKRGIAYCNEEGFLKRLEINKRAHDFWRKACPKGDPERMTVVGPIVYVGLEPANAAKG